MPTSRATCLPWAPRAPATTEPHTQFDPTAGLISKIDLELQLPADFPGKYRDAIVNAMNLCAVKKHLQRPPSFEITTVAPVAV